MVSKDKPPEALIKVKKSLHHGLAGRNRDGLNQNGHNSPPSACSLIVRRAKQGGNAGLGGYLCYHRRSELDFMLKSGLLVYNYAIISEATSWKPGWKILSHSRKSSNCRRFMRNKGEWRWKNKNQFSVPLPSVDSAGRTGWWVGRG